jgi:hypothetical protein
VSAPDPVTVHQLLTRDEILELTPLPGFTRRDWLEVLVRHVEADTLQRAARLARELEVLLPHSGIVREAVAVALKSRASAAARIASRIVTDDVVRRTAHLRRVK